MELFYKVEDKPKFSQLIVFALQQLLAIMAATIAVPAIVGHGMSPSATLFGAGVGTLVYLLFTKFKSPVFLGSSFAFLGSMSAAFAGATTVGLTDNAGFLGLLMGDKFSLVLKKIFEIISVSLFVIFMFIYFLLVTINVADAMGPTAWTIKIVSMIACLGLLGIYIVSRFVNVPVLSRLSGLFALIFVLVLLLELLFTVDGSATVLGNIDILLAAIFAIFSFYLFSTLQKDAEEAPKKVEKKKEEPKEEAKEEPAPEEGK